MKFRYLITVLMTSFLVAQGIADNRPESLSPKEALDKAEKWYMQRAENTVKYLKASPEPINKAIRYAKKALEHPSTEQEASIVLLKSYHYKAKYVQMSDDEEHSLYKTSKNFGEKMHQKYPENDALKFWYMGNLGGYGQTLGMIGAARQGVAGKVKQLCEELIETSPQYDEAGPYRVLGILHFKLPRIPFVLGWPDDEKGLKYLRKASEIASENPSNLFFYAQQLEEEGYYEKAKNVLNEVIQREPRQQHLLEERKTIRKAKKIYREWTE